MSGQDMMTLSIFMQQTHELISTILSPILRDHFAALQRRSQKSVRSVITLDDIFSRNSAKQPQSTPQTGASLSIFHAVKMNLYTKTQLCERVYKCTEHAAFDRKRGAGGCTNQSPLGDPE